QPVATTMEIICDFDGTVARPDTVDELLEALADPAWRGIEERWRRGEIDSRECMARQVPLLRGGWTAIARFLDERVTVHPSFARLWVAGPAEQRADRRRAKRLLRRETGRCRLRARDVARSLQSGADPLHRVRELRYGANANRALPDDGIAT